MTIMSVPLGKLQVSPLNVRTNKEDAESTAALEASILAHGLLEPMVAHPLAKPKGHFGIYAGGRRLRALQNLHGRGALPADYAAEIVVRDLSDAEITEASTAENTLRRNLRPYEVYAAYRNAVERGVNPEDLALHFGQRQIYVDQILRLGRLHPLIFAELEAGRLSDDQARAYAATEDQDLQLAVFSNLRKLPEFRREPRDIRAAMKVGDRDTAQMLAFVGRDNYIKAGGGWDRDLFDESGQSGRVVDPELLARLVAEKRTRISDKIAANCNRPITFVDKPPTTGGQYAYVDHDLLIDVRRSPYSEEQKARKAELEKLKAALEDRARETLLDQDGQRLPGLEAVEAAIDAEYDPVVAELDEISESRRYFLPKKGDVVCTIDISAVGEPNVRFWYASRKAKKEALSEPTDRTEIAEGAALDPAGNYSATKAAGARLKDDLGLTAAGVEIARSLRRTLMRAMLVQNAQRGGDVSVDYLVWSQLRGAIFEYGGDRRGEVGAFTISAGMYDSMADSVDAMPHLKESRAHEVWEQAIALLKEQTFITGKNLGGAFIDFQNAKPELKALAAAVVAGLSLKRSMNADGYRVDVHDVLANATARSYPEAIREIWSPTAAFLDLLPKAKRLDQVEPMVDAKTFAAWGKKKAGEITDLVLKVLTGRSPSLKAAGVTAAKSWVHPLLQFGRPNVMEPADSAGREAA